MKYRGVEVFGRTEEIAGVLETAKPDEIAITLGLSEYSKLEHIVAVCEKSGVHTKFIPDYNNIILPVLIRRFDGLPVINIRHVPLTNTFNAFMKRSMDLAGADMRDYYLFACDAGDGHRHQTDFSGPADLYTGKGRTS